jgi:hypothetical protein
LGEKGDINLENFHMGLKSHPSHKSGEEVGPFGSPINQGGQNLRSGRRNDESRISAT